MVLKRWGRAILWSVPGIAVAAGWAEEPSDPPVSTVWNGVYTDAQAERGAQIYAEPCGRCHGMLLNGAPDDPDMLPAPPIAGAKFLRNWDGRTLAALYEVTRTTMPALNPGYLSDAEVVDIIAYILQISGIPPGETELAPRLSDLAGILIEQAP